MPVYFHELPRPAYQRPRKAAGPFKLALINIAVLSTLLAIWLARPQPPEAPVRRTATIKLVPMQPLPSPATGPARLPASEHMRAPAADPLEVGTITPAPAPPSQGFREVERAAPQKYVGFREIGAER